MFSHRRTQPGGRVRFKGRKGTVDLTKSPNKIVVEPGELLTVQTIERVRLGRGIAALILPRLTLATAGLHVASSYIDPGWDGVLQLSLVNSSSRPYELCVGEQIAVCRFYRTSSPVSEEHTQLFPQKSHHFGLTWARVLDTDNDPMPLRKQPVARRDLAHLVSQVRGAWRYIVSAVGVAAVVGVLLWLGGRSADLNRALTVTDSVELQQAALDAAKEDLGDLRARVATTGTATVNFGAADTSAVITVDIQSATPSPVVLVSVGSPNTTAAARLRSQTPGRLMVEFVARRETVGQPDAVLVSYAVL